MLSGKRAGGGGGVSARGDGGCGAGFAGVDVWGGGVVGVRTSAGSRSPRKFSTNRRQAVIGGQGASSIRIPIFTIPGPDETSSTSPGPPSSNGAVLIICLQGRSESSQSDSDSSITPGTK